MKRLTMSHHRDASDRTTTTFSIPAISAEWNEFTLPAVPSADWPASLALDYAIDRVVREALSSGRSLQEAVARVSELANAFLPQMSDTELDVRVHAQVLANI